ncbi:hypothetical protein KFK14_11320 [Sphingobium phenoxybenzoativorans]|uniref:PEP-CTERM protein-sorting domain-containing protein n=1 Tax=Sphingobium phenoxybenzoativorans TaxID=1592790 RepID=A0A975KAP1_9SPHN|nr:hypothetical protein [Sphingobium phenoxybenzoativorans]QUT07919.1 hypothetical protein KFK14_11320 [Sphingobium phenoxybenzoativorans]
MIRLFLRYFIALLAVGAANQASASGIPVQTDQYATYTFLGDVLWGTDNDGLFGAPGDLTGRDVILTFALLKKSPTNVSGEYDISKYVFGKDGYAIITINGVSQKLPGLTDISFSRGFRAGSGEGADKSGYGSLDAFASGSGGSFVNGGVFSTYSPGFTGTSSVFSPLVYEDASFHNALGEFLLNTSSDPTHVGAFATLYLDRGGAVSPVPGPEGWLVILAGIGAFAYIQRRRAIMT